MALVALGAWLAVVGLGDLGRAGTDAPGHRHRLALIGGGAVLLLVTVLWLPVGALDGVLMWVLLTATHAGWVWSSSEALERGPREVRWLALAFGSFGAGIVCSLLGAVWFDGVVDWPSFLGGFAFEYWPLTDVVVASGVVLVQLATANVIVRLLLDSVGVPATRGEKKLKGGRLLGPMERLFIIGLGVVGQLTAAAIVVAAKGLLRFPEVQQDAKRSGAGDGAEGPSDLTEYFLIGSFASWLIALAGVALIYVE